MPVTIIDTTRSVTLIQLSLVSGIRRQIGQFVNVNQCVNLIADRQWPKMQIPVDRRCPVFCSQEPEIRCTFTY